jgi:hypothetical protein
MSKTLFNLYAKPYIPKSKLYKLNLLLQNDENFIEYDNYILNLNTKPYIRRNNNDKY